MDNTFSPLLTVQQLVVWLIQWPDQSRVSISCQSWHFFSMGGGPGGGGGFDQPASQQQENCELKHHFRETAVCSMFPCSHQRRQRFNYRELCDEGECSTESVFIWQHQHRQPGLTSCLFTQAIHWLRAVALSHVTGHGRHRLQCVPTYPITNSHYNQYAGLGKETHICDDKYIWRLF